MNSSGLSHESAGMQVNLRVEIYRVAVNEISFVLLGMGPRNIVQKKK